MIIIKLKLTAPLTREDARTLAPGGGDAVILVDGSVPDCYLRREARHKSVKRRTKLAKAVYANQVSADEYDVEHMIIPTHNASAPANTTAADFVPDRLNRDYTISTASEHVKNAFNLLRQANYHIVIIPYYEKQNKLRLALKDKDDNDLAHYQLFQIEREINLLMRKVFEDNQAGNKVANIYVCDLRRAQEFIYLHYCQKVGKAFVVPYDFAAVNAELRMNALGEKNLRALYSHLPDTFKLITIPETFPPKPATSIAELAMSYASSSTYALQRLLENRGNLLPANPKLVAPAAMKNENDNRQKYLSEEELIELLTENPQIYKTIEKAVKAEALIARSIVCKPKQPSAVVIEEVDEKPDQPLLGQNYHGYGSTDSSSSASRRI